MWHGWEKIGEPLLAVTQPPCRRKWVELEVTSTNLELVLSDWHGFRPIGFPQISDCACNESLMRLVLFRRTFVYASQRTDCNTDGQRYVVQCEIKRAYLLPFWAFVVLSRTPSSWGSRNRNGKSELETVRLWGDGLNCRRIRWVCAPAVFASSSIIQISSDIIQIVDIYLG